ncbi:hypothetical protein MGG_15770 [Pyricularia oryzae 70-15]|uniref:Uncharacterized protein n=2 Tax=Pyricularia oryzae TaxID=318829 RepID=G4MVT7_PYRO7|nr:uncharacterized protein MGG_15770 [Pyricularia oryzae 70-15]EHA55003.1 hypothetical protein MGG_15770 [Pyricularia oryzae 70-15]KAI7924709.1 hypothetical protein M9X92_003727 [Pyricularia oryzae]KAI7928018.1 hypothetical protein M0657_002859 [Pyricularia oryzae]QBZ56649.1 hypothetical protein PoMZ_01560 [Pyricularia oryzae]
MAETLLYLTLYQQFWRPVLQPHLQLRLEAFVGPPAPVAGQAFCLLGNLSIRSRPACGKCEQPLWGQPIEHEPGQDGVSPPRPHLGTKVAPMSVSGNNNREKPWF